MDKNKIFKLINNTISNSGFGHVDIFFEDDDVLRLEIVSNKFKGIRLLKRIEILTELFIDLAQSEFSDFHLLFNPLTETEKLKGESELFESNDDDTKDRSGLAASSLY